MQGQGICGRNVISRLIFSDIYFKFGLEEVYGAHLPRLYSIILFIMLLVINKSYLYNLIYDIVSMNLLKNLVDTMLKLKVELSENA